MSTNLKIGIAVAALVALVFGVTIISQLPAGGGGDGPSLVGGDTGEVAKSGLLCYAERMRYMPDSGRAEYREYPMYYEAGDLTVPFWVKNSNDVPITVRFGYTSCGQCSLAEFAVVPGLPFDPEGDPDPYGAVVGGIAGKPPLDLNDPPFGLNDVAYRARQKVEAAVPAGEWKKMVPPNSTREYADAVPEVVVPAAAGPDRPTWVIIRLNVTLSTSKVLETRFDCQRADSPAVMPLGLVTALQLVEPCQVSPSGVDFGSMSEGVETAEETVYFWSHTRGFTPSADGLLTPLPPPDLDAIRVKHLSFTPPVPATPDEIAALAKKLSAGEEKPPVRVKAAYKTTMTFQRTITEDGKRVEADLGPFDRSVGFVPNGTGLVLTNTPTVKVKAQLRGPVWLAEGKNVKDDKIDLGSFNSRAELVRAVTLASDTPGLELEVVPEMTEPKYLKVNPTLKVDRTGNRTQWTLTLSIDKDVGGGELKPGSVVVLRIKGTGQLLRIPVTGRGVA